VTAERLVEQLAAELTPARIEAFAAAVDGVAAQAGPLVAALDTIPPRGGDRGPTGSGDDWPGTILLTESFAHIGTSPGCLGYTMTSDGLAWCGACGWRMSARLRDAGELASARFAMAALARIGEAIARVAAAHQSGKNCQSCNS